MSGPVAVLSSRTSPDALLAANRGQPVVVYDGTVPTDELTGRLAAAWQLGDATVSAAANPGPLRRASPQGDVVLVGPDMFEFAGTTSLSTACERWTAHGLVHRIVPTWEIASLRVLIDGSCFLAPMSGTQTYTLELINALRHEPRVAQVDIAFPGVLPSYAAAVSDLKVHHVPLGLDFSALSGYDIIHRPFQPHGPLPLSSWRTAGRRVIMTLLDLIADDATAYHGDHHVWERHRDGLRHGLGLADAVTTISNDVRQAALDAWLPIDPSRLHAVPTGVDHLVADGTLTKPAGLGAGTSPFLLMLGTGFPHKNHALGAAAWRLLRDQGSPLGLVVAGAQPEPLGDDVVSLGPVSAHERSWLLANASAVIYPTSAEGFGLVPFEAAALGTPTVSVKFGPLAETAPTVPIHATGWTAVAFATALAAVLDQPAAQVAAYRGAATQLTWAATARATVDVYIDALARPSLAELAVDRLQTEELDAANHELAYNRPRLDALERSRAVRVAHTVREQVAAMQTWRNKRPRS